MRKPIGYVILALLTVLGYGFAAHRPQSSKTPVSELVKQDASLLERNYITIAEVNAKHEYELERGITFPKLVRGNPGRKEIALTFDDGPHPGRTERLLEILKQEKVRATFFVVGKMVDQNPDLVRMEAALGHEVANHTYNHVRLPSIPAAAIEAELRDGSSAIERAIGQPVRLYRPPGGEYNDEVIQITKNLNKVMVLWTDDPADFAQPGQEIILQRTLKHLSNGGIILLHDGVPQMLEMLPELIHKLKQKGFKFVTCSEMARQSGVIKTGGPRILTPKERGALRLAAPKKTSYL